MRTLLSIAAAAALSIAAPAAAQPDVDQIVRETFQKLAASHPPEVEDYTLTLAYEGLRLPMYIYRSTDGWEVVPVGESPLNEMLQLAVIWPILISGDFGVDDASVEGAEDGGLDLEYAGTEAVGGRPAHVVALRTANGKSLGSTKVDSMRLSVDAESGELVRLHVAGELPGDEEGEEEGDFVAGGDLTVTVDMLDHAVTDGLRIPRRVRLRMGLEMPEMDPAELAELRLGLTMALSETTGNDAASREMRVIIELFSAILEGGEIDVDALVKGVRVNSGPPDSMK
jgi:hypothetical protein